MSDNRAAITIENSLLQETTETFGKSQLVPPFLTLPIVSIYTHSIVIPG